MREAKGAAYRKSRVGTRADAIVISASPRREAMTEDYLTLPIAGEPRPRGERFAAMVRAEGDALVLY